MGSRYLPAQGKRSFSWMNRANCLRRSSAPCKGLRRTQRTGPPVYSCALSEFWDRMQLYTVPVQLRSCRRLDEIGLAFCSPSRFHPKENCIFLALLRSYPFAALAQERSAPRSVPGQRAQLNTIPDRSSRAILAGGFCIGGDTIVLTIIFENR